MPLFYYVSDHEKDAMHKPLDAERLLRMLGASGKLAGFRQAAYMIERVRENPKGEVQLYMGNDRSFMDFYMIRGVPRFILIAPDGRIINSDMLRPSDPETAKTLRAYLKEK
mgnify:CR=1 FL=1